MPLALAAEIRIEDALVEVSRENQPDRVVFGAIAANIHVTGLDQPIRFTGHGSQRGLPGEVALDGEIGLEDLVAGIAGLPRARVSIDLQQLDISAAAGLLNEELQGIRFSGSATATVTAELDSSGHTQLQTKLALEDLAAAGGPLGSDHPSAGLVTLDMEGSADPGHIALRQFVLDSPFVRCQATGGLILTDGQLQPGSTATLTARADLPAIAAAFPATLRLRSSTEIVSGSAVLEATAAEEAHRTALTVQGRIVELGARHNSALLELDAPLHFDAAAGLDSAGNVTLTRLEASSSFATLQASGADRDYAFNVAVDLEQATAEARKFVELDDYAAAGTIKVSASLRQDPTATQKASLDAIITGLRLEGATPLPLVIERITANAAAESQPYTAGEPTILDRAHAELTFPFATLTLDADRIVSGTPFLLSAAKNVRSTCVLDLPAAAAVAASCGVTNSGGILPTAGSVSLQANLQFDTPSLLISNVTVHTQEVTMRSAPDRTTLLPDVRLQADGRIDLKRKTVSLPGVRLSSVPASVELAGALTDWSDSCRLSFHGGSRVDWNAVAEVVASWSGVDIEMRGNTDEPISGSLSLANTNWVDIVRTGEIHASFPIEALTAPGCEATNITIALDAEGGRARLPIGGILNGGSLNLPLMLDTTPPFPLITIPEETRVLTDVALLEGAASDTLARMHPVFAGCSLLGGEIDLMINHLRWPVATSQWAQASAEAVLSLRDVAITPSGLLAELMTVLGQSSHPGRLPDQDVTFTCREGRIHASPLTLESHDAILTFSGSIGLDGTLDYVAEVPLTESMVDASIYRYLKNTRVKIVIRGTTEHPVVSRQSLAATIKQAVSEGMKNLIQDQGKELLEKVFGQ